jgi:hypothetical protein
VGGEPASYNFRTDQQAQIELKIERRTPITDPRLEAGSGKVEVIVEVEV